MIVLKPCAKCGGEPELFYTKWSEERQIPGIRCKRCGHTNQQWFWKLDRLVEVWNTWYRDEEDET